MQHAQKRENAISIHALREEGDVMLRVVVFAGNVISIHALREEGDGLVKSRRKTVWNFNPRPPRGGRQGYIDLPGLKNIISIHALREEGDPRCVSWTQR